MLSNSIDITPEQLEQLKLLDKVIALMPGHVYWKDKKGRYLGCNDAQAHALGLKSRADIVNVKAYATKSKEQANILRQGDESVLTQGKTITIEEHVTNKEGQDKVSLTKKKPIYNDSGEITGLLGVSFDITDRKNAEATLTANATMTAFIENMEHDIRTPFCGIYGLIDLLANDEPDPERKALLIETSKCAEELLAYCNGILDFSKVQLDNTQIEEKNFSLCQLANSIITIERAAALNKKLSLSLSYDKKLNDILRGDPYRIKRILLNLISNAIKFTNTGSVKLSIVLEKPSDRHREIIVKFTVKDTGCGIPADKHYVVYERFTKLSPSNKGLYKGLGLGLRIVKKFVEQLDGEIHLQSELNKGSEFSVYLPLRIPLANNLIDN